MTLVAMAEDSDLSRQEAVVVLVTEDFFCDRICSTLLALGREAIRILPGENLLQRVLAVDCLGVVIDLEDQHFDAPELLRGLRDSPTTGAWTFQSFCSHEHEELMAKAAVLGLTVTPRSTFALNLVRKMQEFDTGKEPKS